LNGAFVAAPGKSRFLVASLLGMTNESVILE